jgi:hypothetical protein
MKNRLVQKYAYEYCYPLSSVVDRLAEFDLTGEVEIFRISGKGKEDIATNGWANNFRRIMQKPNPLQSWTQFRGQQLVYKRVFGFCPVLPIIPAGFTPDYAVALINLPPWLFYPKRKPIIDFFTATKLEDLVDGWRVNILGKYVELEPNDVFILEDGFLQEETNGFILPQSKLVGLDMAISNLCAGMEADNVLLRKRGPLGFISHDAAATKDGTVGYLPMTKKEQRILQNDLQRYGVSWQQFQYVVSRTPSKWNSMGYDVKQLGTKETIDAAERAICHRFGYPYVLYEEQDATYANGNNAKKGVYQDIVIPSSKNDWEKYMNFFLAAENNCVIKACFDDVAALQEDGRFKAQADLYNTQASLVNWQNNVITLVAVTMMWRQILIMLTLLEV